MSQVFIGNDIGLVQQASVVVLGPGLGLADWGQKVFNSLIDLAKPMVIDADALTLLAEHGARTTNSPWVLTPHPGEAARLLGCSNVEIQKDRLSAALAIAKKYDCVCVLKGAGTLIAGAGGLPVLCDRGNAGMASAGMGDVLSGMIAAFIGQGIEPRQAAELAVYLHACAADEVVNSSAQASLIASDVINQLPSSLQLLIG
jgi:NAD(P)H-hydrate epimerase